MRDLSVLIPAHNEQFLQCTINDILQHREGDTEILVALDNWSNPPRITNHPRVRVVTTNRGQRGATNILAGYSNAKYLMKLDAHCSLSQGFDVTMMEDMSEDTTLVPALANLHVYDWVCSQGHKYFQSDLYTHCAQCGSTELQKEMVWKIIPKPIRSNFYFDTALHFQYSEEDMPELVAETMSIQGSCFMVTRERYHELNLCDEAFGSWGQQGTEVACKSWLSGGRVLSTKKAYYGHFFQEKMPNPVDETLKTQEYSRELFLKNKWPLQKYPIQWLIKRFGYQGDWSPKKVKQLCSPWILDK